MSPILEITLGTDPVPWARTGQGKYGRYTPRKVRDYKNAIAWAICAAYQGPVIDFGVHVKLRFYFKRPKRLLKKSSPKGPIPHTQKPDEDNLVKAVLDGISQSGFWRDDCLVCRKDDAKFFTEIGGKARVELAVWPVEAMNEN